MFFRITAAFRLLTNSSKVVSRERFHFRWRQIGCHIHLRSLPRHEPRFSMPRRFRQVFGIGQYWEGWRRTGPARRSCSGDGVLRWWTRTGMSVPREERRSCPPAGSASSSRSRLRSWR